MRSGETADRRPCSPCRPAWHRCGSGGGLPWSELQPGPGGIVVRNAAVALPRGAGLDSGGIGKGLAADLVAAAARRGGASGICVNLGGDVRVMGEAPGGAGWTVGLDYPGQQRTLAVVGLTDGALATSTTLLRHWRQDGRFMHHLIDPATREPSSRRVVFASVVAAEAWQAEVLTKAVMLTPDEPLGVLSGTGAEGLAIDRDGDVLAAPGLAAYLGGRRLPRRLASGSASETDADRVAERG